jgi:hypothetical protein
MGIDDQYVTEFTKENVLKVEGMRQQLLEAWKTKGGGETF